jgi:hypothetical protein
MLAHAKTRNAAAQIAPTMPFLVLGDARNCQLPSSNNQNKISRYSPFFKFVDNPDIPFSCWPGAVGVSSRLRRFMYSAESFGVRGTPALKWSYPDSTSPLARREVTS